FDQSLEPAAGDQAPPEEVEPHALSCFTKLQQWIHVTPPMPLSDRYPLPRRRTPAEPAAVEDVFAHLSRTPRGTAVLLDERVARAGRRILQRARKQVLLLRVGRQRVRRPPFDEVQRVPHAVQE